MAMEAKDVKCIVIHCADTYDSMDIGAKEIDTWHKRNGWAGIGYHFVIRRSGLVESGRPLDLSLTPGWQIKEGAHVSGHNYESVGVCVVGGKPEANYTAAQWASLRTTVDFLKLCFPKAEVLGHRDLDSGKACPCFDASKWYNDGDVIGWRCD
jgi:N-acetyl-anhydromuramyl-L-alanine amidase AmpD